MAASQKGKKAAVKQEDLRRLMRQKQRDGERQKRVESPFARYSGAGQLTCAICDVPVKSALLWQTHVLGKQHKDKVQELKNRQAAPPSSSSSSSSSVLKRPAQPQQEPAPGKRAKLQSATGVSAGRPEPKVVSAGLGLLAGHYDDDDDDDDKDDEGKNPPPTDSALPADFFDSGASSAPAAPPPPAVSHSGSVSKAGGGDDDDEEEKKKKEENSGDVLPEGFFDDPVRDAKVRNVDTPKDQMDREWEEFQKEMRQVNSASDAIVAEDDEEVRLERQIDEIDEQILCLQRVEKLRVRQEIAKRRIRRRRQKMQEEEMQRRLDEEEEEVEDDDEELMHVLTQDWRAKGALA